MLAVVDVAAAEVAVEIIVVVVVVVVVVAVEVEVVVVAISIQWKIINNKQSEKKNLQKQILQLLCAQPSPVANVQRLPFQSRDFVPHWTMRNT